MAVGNAKEERLKRVLMGAQLAAARKVRGLYLQPGDPGYNPDADVPWKEATTATRAALVLANASLAAERAKQDQRPQASFGVLFVPAALASSAEWQEEARRLQSPARPAIEVVAAPAKEAK